MAKKKDKSNELWWILICAAFLFVLLIGLLLVSSRVEFEADCSITGLNIEINETNDFNNFSLQDSSIRCKFKGDVPMGIALKSLR